MQEKPLSRRSGGLGIASWQGKLLWTTTLAALLTAAFGLFSGAAEAVRLKAKVYMTQEKIPRGLEEKELIAFARKHQAKRIEETKEAAVKDRRWRAYVLVAFNAPPGKLEYEMVFYDVQRGKRILIERQSTLLSDPYQKNYVQRVTLKRPKYQPSTRMELVIVVSGQEVGSLKFSLMGDKATGAASGAPAGK